MGEDMEEGAVIEEPEPPKSSGRAWLAYLALVFVGLLFIWLASGGVKDLFGQHSPEVIKLSGAERQKAMALVERRQSVMFMRQESTAAYQAEMNRLAEADNQISLDNAKMCFELKKAHSLDPGVNYQLDEFKGQLVRNR